MPFQSSSKAGWGVVIVTVLQFILPSLGVEAPEGSIQAVAEALITVVGFVLLVFGQWDRKDLDYGLFRKDRADVV